MIGRDDIGRRHRALPHELGDAGLHEHVASHIADHRIAAITRLRIGGLHLRHRIQHRRADLGRAEIAGQHAVARPEHAALVNALHHLTDHAGVERAAAPRAVARMIGELHGEDRPHLDADPLQRERRGRIADMAIGDVGLDREDVHRAILAACALTTKRKRRGPSPRRIHSWNEFDQPAFTFPSRPPRRTCWCRSSTGRSWPWPRPATTG